MCIIDYIDGLWGGLSILIVLDYCKVKIVNSIYKLLENVELCRMDGLRGVKDV